MPTYRLHVHAGDDLDEAILREFEQLVWSRVHRGTRLITENASRVSARLGCGLHGAQDEVELSLEVALGQKRLRVDLQPRSNGEALAL